MPHRKKSLLMSASLALVMLFASVAQAQLPDFTQLVEQSAPAVVNISTRQNIQQRQASVGGQYNIPELEGLPPIFREFFERSFPVPGAPQGRPKGQQREAQSLG